MHGPDRVAAAPGRREDAVPTAAPSASFASALVGRYAIERSLGAGGMAHVWLAHDLRHDRRVALKVLRSDLGAALGAERFLAEIRTTAQLVHPHILPLLDSGEAAGFLWFATPYVDGETLRTRLTRETQLPVAEAARIAGEIASALDAAHRRGIIHRDVKPENVLMQDGAALVADFGIALALRGAGVARLTETGLSLGTPHYMSPEQAAGDPVVDARTDVYTVGAVLYEMLTGEPPHTGATAQAVVAKVLAEAPTPVRTVRPTVSPALEAVVHRALAKTAADRFRSAGEMAAALAAPDIVTPASGISTRPRPTGRWQHRITALVVLVFAIVAGVATWPIRKRTPSAAVPLAAGVQRIQLTETGNIRAPALTPDGQRIAYSVRTCDSGGQCGSEIELRDLAGAGRLRLAGGFGTVNDLSWSADGRWLVVQGTRNSVFGTFVVPALGGEPRFTGCCYGNFLGRGDTIAISPIRHASRVPRVYLRTSTDGVLRDSIVLHGVRADFAIFEASPRGNLLAMLGGKGSRMFGHIVRRDGSVVDTLPGRPPGNGAWRWSAGGNALFLTDRDTTDRRLLGLWSFGVDPQTGRRDGPPRPVALREQSQVGRFDVANTTGDVAIELSNRRHVVWLLTRDGSRYQQRQLRRATLPLFAALEPNGARAVLGAVAGDSTLSLSVLDVDTGRERPLARVRWSVSAFVELFTPVRWTDVGDVLLTRPPVGSQPTEVLRVRPNGSIDTLARVTVMGDAVPAPDGGILYADQPQRLIRLAPNGTSDTLTFPDSVPWMPLWWAPVDRHRTVMFVVDNASGADNQLRLVDWRVRDSTRRLAKIDWDDGPITVAAYRDTAFVAVQPTPGQLQLLAVPLHGGPSRVAAALPTAGLDFPLVQFSADRRRVLLVGVEDFSDIWLLKGALPRDRR